MYWDEDTSQGFKIAEQQLGNFDLLIDIFDLTIVWMNEKTSESASKKPEYFIGKEVSEVTLLGSDEYASFIRNIVSKDAMPAMLRIPIKVGDGKTIIYEANHYPISLTTYPRFIAVKIIKVEKC